MSIDAPFQSATFQDRRTILDSILQTGATLSKMRNGTWDGEFLGVLLSCRPESVQSSLVGRPPKAIRRDLQGSKFLDEKLRGESHLIFRVAYFLISNLADSHRGIGTSCDYRYKWSEIGIDAGALDYHAGCLETPTTSSLSRMRRELTVSRPSRS
jgi:hypothetical protein